MEYFLIKKGGGASFVARPCPVDAPALSLSFVAALRSGEQSLKAVTCIVDGRSDTNFLTPFYVFANRVVLSVLACQLRPHLYAFHINGAPPNSNCNAPKIHLGPAFRALMERRVSIKALHSKIIKT
jgi:hypothetical protein